jgi:hypothetical protein
MRRTPAAPNILTHYTAGDTARLPPPAVLLHYALPTVSLSTRPDLPAASVQTEEINKRNVMASPVQHFSTWRLEQPIVTSRGASTHEHTHHVTQHGNFVFRAVDIILFSVIYSNAFSTCGDEPQPPPPHTHTLLRAHLSCCRAVSQCAADGKHHGPEQARALKLTGALSHKDSAPGSE